MAWRIEFDPAAAKELSKLDEQSARRILKFLRQRVAPSADARSIGEAMKGARFGGLWRYRVGDFRIVVAISDQSLRILVVRVGNRREVYRR